MATETIEKCINPPCQKKFKLVETGGGHAWVEKASYECPYCGHRIKSHTSGCFETLPIKADD